MAFGEIAAGGIAEAQASGQGDDDIDDHHVNPLRFQRRKKPGNPPGLRRVQALARTGISMPEGARLRNRPGHPLL
jgi:hypothetical protein